MMIKAKKRANVAQQQDREERVSLLGCKTPATTTPPSSGNSSGILSFRNEKRKTSAIAKAHPDFPMKQDEERVSLIGGGGSGGNRRRDGTPPRRPLRIAVPGKRLNNTTKMLPWTLSRMMKYMALMLISSTVTFILLHKQSREVHWEEYHKILEPEGTKEKRCFEQSRAIKDERCTCPDPDKALGNTTSAMWMSHHKNMVHIAQHPPDDLDVVFIGDGVIEQLSGTLELGTKNAEGMEDYFEQRFTKKSGGRLNAIALGSSGDTGPNLLWHWENGIAKANLKPKVWFINVGANDLFVSKCTDRFVFANVLNVLKRLYESQPEATFIVHGIMPRKDNPDSESNALGHLWNRAQDINLLVKKFTKRKARIHFINAGPKFLMESGFKGRRFLDPTLIADGINPTPKGMQVWGDIVEKKIKEIMHGFDSSRLKQKGKVKDRTSKNDTPDETRL